MSNIAAQIDINGNSAPADAQINDMAFKEIRAIYSEGAELRILRSYLTNPTDAIAAAHFDKYSLDVSAITADSVAAKVIAADVRSALAYESAQGTVGYWQRFADYIATAQPGTVDPAQLDRYHASIDPANAIIAAATPAILVTVALRATHRQALLAESPSPAGGIARNFGF